MPAQIFSNVHLKTGQPLDARLRVVDISALEAIPAQERYPQMRVYVDSEGAEYCLINGLLNIHWQRVPANLGAYVFSDANSGTLVAGTINVMQGSFNGTLPADPQPSMHVMVVNISGLALTVVPDDVAGGERINGATSFNLGAGKSALLIYVQGGSHWRTLFNN